MLKLFWSSLLMLAAWACPGVAHCADLADADRTVLAALAARADALWDAGDADGLASLYRDDADLRLGAGDAHATRDAIRAYFTASFARRPPGLRHVTELLALREVAPGVVFADGHVRLEREHADGRRELVRRFVNHTVLVREADGWRFVSVRAHPLPEETKTPAG